MVYYSCNIIKQFFDKVVFETNDLCIYVKIKEIENTTRKQILSLKQVLSWTKGISSLHSLKTTINFGTIISLSLKGLGLQALEILSELYLLRVKERGRAGKL